jgi:UMP-CMP kinase
MEVTVRLLQNAMQESLDKRKPSDHPPRFLIDGFPRQVDQAIKFEEEVCPCKFVVFFDCPEDIMEARLLNRGKTSGRSDDNIESIKKRFKTFVHTSMPVIDMFAKDGKVLSINAAAPVETVYSTVKSEVGRLLKEKEGK